MIYIFIYAIKGGNDEENAKEFIKNKFLEKNIKKKKIQVYFITAIDKNSIKNMFDKATKELRERLNQQEQKEIEISKELEVAIE